MAVVLFFWDHAEDDDGGEGRNERMKNGEWKNFIFEFFWDLIEEDDGDGDACSGLRQKAAGVVMVSSDEEGGYSGGYDDCVIRCKS